MLPYMCQKSWKWTDQSFRRNRKKVSLRAAEMPWGILLWQYRVSAELVKDVNLLFKYDAYTQKQQITCFFSIHGIKENRRQLLDKLTCGKRRRIPVWETALNDLNESAVRTVTEWVIWAQLFSYIHTTTAAANESVLKRWDKLVGQSSVNTHLSTM